MLAKARRHHFRNSISFATPLFVPSFTSKGFGAATDENSTHQYSKVINYFEAFAEAPSTTVLISAYDLHFGHLSRFPEDLSGVLDKISKCSTIFLDSGGYELLPDFDSTEPREPEYSPRGGYSNEANYREVLSNIQKESQNIPLVIANFDYRDTVCPLKDQVAAAKALFGEFPEFSTNFIIKPDTPKQNLDVNAYGPHDIDSLKDFAVIGVTEKELGADLLSKLKQIALLRSRLDSNGIEAPIHIWGGLDPVIASLYFFAGAEIVDGVSWLRYSFTNGVALYRNCAPFFARPDDIDRPEEEVRILTNSNNLHALASLAENLSDWHDSNGEIYEQFSPWIAGELREAYTLMRERIPQLREGG